MRSLAGNIAIVTGAGQGIGKSIAICLAKRGAQVMCLDINDAENEKTAAEASKFSDCLAFHCDVGNPQQISCVFDEILSQKSAIDILVNNAAVFSTMSFAKSSYSEALTDFEFNINTNLRGAFLCAKKAAPQMVKQQSGQIINIITNHVKRYLFPPSENEHSYDASKFAQLALNESLNCELREHGIRVNAICPAATRSPMLQSFFDSIGMELTKENIGKCSGFESLLECDEVGQAVCAVLQWDDFQPTGKAILLMYSEDCTSLENGFREDLAK